MVARVWPRMRATICLISGEKDAPSKLLLKASILLQKAHLITKDETTMLSFNQQQVFPVHNLFEIIKSESQLYLAMQCLLYPVANGPH